MKIWPIATYLIVLGLMIAGFGDTGIANDDQASLAVDTWEGTLRPLASLKDLHERHVVEVPFYQAIPVAPGRLYPVHLSAGEDGLRHSSGRLVPAVTSPAALWPDGSVQWLAVDGLWPGDLPINESDGERVTLPFAGEQGSIALRNTVVDSLDVEDGKIRLLDRQGKPVATLSPRASYLEITEKKVVLPDSVPDDERQYAWAEPLEVLNPGGTPKSFDLRVREHIVEKDNALFTVYRLRGDGGSTRPGSGLEWQLRVRIYKGAPMVRLQMTWGFHWNPEKYALTQAEWVASFTNPLVTARVPGVKEPLDLTQGFAQMASDPTGRGYSSYNGNEVATAEWPDAMWDVSVVRFDESPQLSKRFLGIGTPRFTRLGPNHLLFDEDRIVFASWSDRSGLGLDLRLTAQVDEFGMSRSDVTTDGAGVMGTMEASLIWGQSSESALSVALWEAKRDFLWLPSRHDLIESGSFGPWAPEPFEDNKGYFDDLNIGLHFLVSARDYWRWNGWANFGDMRTNFSRGSNSDRGLYPDRWALYGRYGWRKGSAEPYRGMWVGALALEERAIALAAFDYALHVSDVDVIHGSFFGTRSPQSGGMHRRNKDHWSGSAQMQYTPSAGLYITQWLTGHERISETLEEVREYARTRGDSGSAYAGQAWIYRYRETHDPKDLAMARKLLDRSALWWERRGLTAVNPGDTWGNPDPGAKLSGLAALYQNNFRLPTNGIPVLIDFYEATDDREYLDAILASLQVHGIPSRHNPGLGDYYGLSYLLLNGYTEREVGIDIVGVARREIGKILSLIPSQSSSLPREEWTYDNLMRLASQGSSIGPDRFGSRGVYSPVVIQYFGRPTLEVSISSPRHGGRVGGMVPVRVEWGDPRQAPGVERVLIEVNDRQIYNGTDLPSPDELSIDTLAFGEGTHHLIVTTEHKEYGVNHQVSSFVVMNRWSLVQNMNPPVTEGWFGMVDFLQTQERSPGWAYETGQSQQFFGDVERLVRATDVSEYLIWKTPRLKTIDITAFVKPGMDIKQGLKLEVSSSGKMWEEIEYTPEIEEGDSMGAWHRVTISVEIEGASEHQLFRLTLTDRLPGDAVQIGAVELSGIRD